MNLTPPVLDQILSLDLGFIVIRIDWPPRDLEPTHCSTANQNLFSDIEPKWENEENRTGGRLVIEIKKEHRNEMLIGNWLNTLLGLIGENCNVEGVAKCYGVQFQSRRKMDKLSLWVASGHSRNEVMNLGAWFKEGADKQSINSGKVKYHLHASQAGKTTSSRRFEYCVWVILITSFHYVTFFSKISFPRKSWLNLWFFRKMGFWNEKWRNMTPFVYDSLLRNDDVMSLP